jgi:hypothetical protein
VKSEPGAVDTDEASLRDNQIGLPSWGDGCRNYTSYRRTGRCASHGRAPRMSQCRRRGRSRAATAARPTARRSRASHTSRRRLTGRRAGCGQAPRVSTTATGPARGTRPSFARVSTSADRATSGTRPIAAQVLASASSRRARRGRAPCTSRHRRPGLRAGRGRARLGVWGQATRRSELLSVGFRCRHAIG